MESILWLATPFPQKTQCKRCHASNSVKYGILLPRNAVYNARVSRLSVPAYAMPYDKFQAIKLLQMVGDGYTPKRENPAILYGISPAANLLTILCCFQLPCKWVMLGCMACGILL